MWRENQFAEATSPSQHQHLFASGFRSVPRFSWGKRWDFHQTWDRKVDIVQNDSTDVNNYSFLCQLSSRMNDIVDIVDIVQDFSWRCPGELRNSACDWVTPNKNDSRNNNHTNSWVSQESGNLGVSKVIPSLVIFRIAANHGPLSSIEICGIKAMAIWKFTGDSRMSRGDVSDFVAIEGAKLIIPMGAGVMSFCCLLYSCCVHHFTFWFTSHFVATSSLGIPAKLLNSSCLPVVIKQPWLAGKSSGL